MSERWEEEGGREGGKEREGGMKGEGGREGRIEGRIEEGMKRVCVKEREKWGREYAW